MNDEQHPLATIRFFFIISFEEKREFVEVTFSVGD